MRGNFAIALLAPVVALAIGVVIGYALNRPVDLEIVPPFSSSSASREMLRGLCTHNAAFAKLTEGERYTEKSLRLERLQATAFSDRGVICVVDGTLRTLKNFSPGSISTIDEKIHQIILVSVTGESEVASEEFLKALLSSRVVRAMSSNVGNDGTAQPKIEVKIAGLGFN